MIASEPRDLRPWSPSLAARTLVSDRTLEATMREAEARWRLAVEARRLAEVHLAVDTEIGRDGSDSDSRPASDRTGADAAARTLEHEVEVSLRATVDDELVEVALALVRLDEGAYGRCSTCGEAIPDARLAEVPATRFCVACEATGERVGAVDRPAVDAALRRALAELDPDPDDDVVTVSAEEAAIHVRRPR